MANDAATVLNTGSGGDSIDETLVTRSDGTSVKRTRVVVGDDDGRLFGKDGPDMPVTNEQMLGALFKIEKHLEHIAMLLTAAFEDQ